MFGIGTRLVRVGESQGERDLEKGAGGWRLSRVLTVVAVSAVAVVMIGPAVARADYEQVPGHFGVSGEEEQL